MTASDNLQPLLFHGTDREIPGGRILPAAVHGQGSHWGTTGSTRGEPSEQFAWAHPFENKTWAAAMDRVDAHYARRALVAPRGRVYAVHPNENQSPGHDPSMAGEIKSTHFDIAHEINIKPGHQGTFPEINWNEHVKKGEYLPGDEDANHPSHLSVQFGHKAGVEGGRERSVSVLHEAAKKEDLDRWIDKADAIGPSRHRDPQAFKDTPLPIPTRTRLGGRA